MYKPTICDVMRDKLGREPTDAELNAEVKRILSEASTERMVKLAGQGRLPHQRRRGRSRT